MAYSEKFVTENAAFIERRNQMEVAAHFSVHEIRRPFQSTTAVSYNISFLFSILFGDVVVCFSLRRAHDDEN